MFRLRNTGLGVVGLTLAVLLSAGPARATEADRYLPDDTEIVMTINVKQILDAPLIKKQGMEKFKEALKQADEIQKTLDSLGFDPLKDIERLTVAGPGGQDTDKGLIIVNGRFDVAKFQAKAEEAAKVHADSLKIHKDVGAGKHTFYEVSIPDQPQTVFVALANKTTILASPGKDYLADALTRSAGQQKLQLKSKELQGLLEKADPKQSFSVTALGSALAKSVPDDSAKEILGKIDAVTGGVTLANDLKIEIAVATKDADAANDLNKTIKDGLNQALGILALLAGNQKELAPLLEVVKSIKTTAKDKLLTIQGEVAGEILEKALNKVGQ